MKNIQISKGLFLALIKYHHFDMIEYEEGIKNELEKKLNLMAKRQYYTDYKTANTNEERESARVKYLDEIGMNKDFRW